MKSMCIPGCVFEHFGKVPENVYQTDKFNSPFEEAVFKDDKETFHNLAKEEGKPIGVRLKIGKMSCIEYCAMMGYAEMLQTLIDCSANASILHQYFEHGDIVERAYLISRNKSLFFDQEALAEANRYEAALYTAVEYNQPHCVKVMLKYLGEKELSPQIFYTSEDHQECLNAKELAVARGHKDCHEALLEHFPNGSGERRSSRSRLSTI